MPGRGQVEYSCKGEHYSADADVRLYGGEQGVELGQAY